MVRNKEKVSVSLSKDILEWLEKMVEKKIFASRSHGIEYCLEKCRSESESKGK